MEPPKIGIFEPYVVDGDDINPSNRDFDLADFREMMKDVKFRRFLWRYLSYTGVFRSTFTGNAMGYFLEGRRNVGLMMMRDLIAACPEMFVVMQKEATDGIYAFKGRNEAGNASKKR